MSQNEKLKLAQDVRKNRTCLFRIFSSLTFPFVLFLSPLKNVTNDEAIKKLTIFSFVFY